MKINEIATVAVIGSGTMGQGIAQACAQAGYPTILFDINESLLAKAKASIENNLRIAVEKGKLDASKYEGIINNISLVKQLEDVRADLIIEAIVEKLAAKQKLFHKLEEINSGHAILASNTSSLSITEIASSLKNPANCVGLHFFNPAHLMKLVEIVSGQLTDARHLDTLRRFSKQLGKIAVMAKDSPGFIVNRVARHYYLESLRLLEEKATDIESIDQLLKSAGFKMGPFELMDLIGIDINYAVSSSVYNGFHQEVRFKPSPIQQQKVEAGQLGRKSGKGFYDYSNR